MSVLPFFVVTVTTPRLYGGGVNMSYAYIKRRVVSRLCCLVDRRAVTRGSSPAVTGVVTGRDPWDPPFHRGRPRPSHHAGVDMRSDAVVQLLGADWSINRRRNSRWTIVDLSPPTPSPRSRSRSFTCAEYCSCHFIPFPTQISIPFNSILLHLFSCEYANYDVYLLDNLFSRVHDVYVKEMSKFLLI